MSTTTTSSNAGDLPDTTQIVRIIEEQLDLEEHRIKLLFVRLYATFLLWVGDPASPVLDNISLAIGRSMTTMAEKNPDLVADSQMASRLSLKYNEGRPVYVAYNYAPMASNSELKLQIEKRIWSFVGKCLVDDGKE